MADQETATDAQAAGILPEGSRTETSFQKPLAFVAAGQKITVLLDGAAIADSADVIIVHEKGHKPMLYFPRGDVAMGLATPMEQTTHCPRKGDASYFEFAGSNGAAVAWSYEDPIPQAAVLKDYLAFYPDNLEFNRES
ncbi:DUF427 domain-containing protein [Parvibaculaceae bacterium PLY_AMNH_Bact1]|nr:DUF427 domain-containing protein [Parvibaculaceae bacterium PLY_AMNH_Bact1]